MNISRTVQLILSSALLFYLFDIQNTVYKYNLYEYKHFTHTQNTHISLQNISYK